MTIRVLLADDHAVVRAGVKALLQQDADISVVGEAANGRDAVRFALELKPDVVIMDLTMPELNGVEAARLLRDKCAAIRVVMLSMHSSSEHVFRAIEAGAFGFILKDLGGSDVAAAVRAVHAGGRYFSPALAEFKLTAQSRTCCASPLDSLSAREHQVLQLVVEGHSSAEIATSVHLSPKSVETYRGRLMKKLTVNNVAGLVRFAIANGLTPSN